MTTVEEPRPKAPDPAGPPEGPDEHSTSFHDVKQLGLLPAIKSLSYVFWICGAMEMVERLAYYGVKAVAVLYVTNAASTGALGVTIEKYGTLMMVFAFVSSILPIFTGGLSDRYGYKGTIFVSTIVKIMGYLVMAQFPTYGGFFGGCMLLAAGTAIFKPGIQGTLVKSTNRKNSSIAWGIFYQTVNIGGLARPPRRRRCSAKMEWAVRLLRVRRDHQPELPAAAHVSSEVGKSRSGKERNRQREERVSFSAPASPVESIRELIRSRTSGRYLLLFSGFWFMFMALFDVLPAHIR